MENERRIKRQGDVSLHPEKGLPKDAIRIADHDGVLARGEATGHAHTIAKEKAEFYETLDGDLYVRIIEDTVIVHAGTDKQPPKTEEEARIKDLHLMLPISRGVWRVRFERDHDPYRETESTAID